MNVRFRWRKELGARLQGSRLLDFSKVQAPCIVPVPSGGYRLFYTAVGPGKPMATCQGYILSAFSKDGLEFHTEPNIRLAPQLAQPHMSRRVLAPTITRCNEGYWRMYFESRGLANRPTVICSAVSVDMLHWEHEEGIRLQGFHGVGGPRYVPLPDGRGRLYCFGSESVEDNSNHHAKHRRQSIISAVSSNGLNFELDPGYRIRDKQATYDTAGITAAEVIPPQNSNNNWTMFFSAWQDAPASAIVPLHPSHDPNIVENELSEDFATASIASDIAGYRSRIFMAHSTDGLEWKRAKCVIEGNGYDSEEIDAVHAEDMSLIKIGNSAYRMYYAACDKTGKWKIASAVTNSISGET